VRGIWRDLVAGVRLHLRTPATTGVALCVLALGIAGSIVAFSVVNAFFLRPMPVRQPERLVRIYASPRTGLQHFTVRYEDVRRMRELRGPLAGVVGEAPLPLGLDASGSAERIWGELVSSDYFSLLGVSPALGRLLDPEHDAKEVGEVAVVLSHDLWMRQFTGSPGAVGEAVYVDGHAARIVGVAPPGFHGTTGGLRPEVWLPAEREASVVRSGGARGYFVVARLAAGAGLREARATSIPSRAGASRASRRCSWS
jgi:hypothetical protein